MTFLDAYALISFLTGGPAAAQVRAILREGDAAVASANLAETLDVCERRAGIPIDCAMEILEPLLEGPLSAVPLDVAVARRAAEIRVRHYQRSEMPLSLADAVLLASATAGARLASADAAVLAVARAEQIEAIALPAQSSAAAGS